MELDKSRAGRVYGSSRAAWFQDGQYFDGMGEPVSFEEAAKPSETAPVVTEPTVTIVPPVTISPPRTPEPEYVAVVDTPVEREKNERNWGDDRYLKLKALTPTVLAAAVMRAGGTPETGKGGKHKNIAWLLKNVKD